MAPTGKIIKFLSRSSNKSSDNNYQQKRQQSSEDIKNMAVLDDEEKEDKLMDRVESISILTDQQREAIKNLKDYVENIYTLSDQQQEAIKNLKDGLKEELEKEKDEIEDRAQQLVIDLVYLLYEYITWRFQ